MRTTYFTLLTALLLVACNEQKTDVPPPEVLVTQPKKLSTVSTNVEVAGEAKGFWFFEATFPIAIIDAKGNTLAQSYATAESNWMTEEYVPFTGTIEIRNTYKGTGSLLIQNANASGLPENSKFIEIPIFIDVHRLSAEEKITLEEYISNNIQGLSPEPAVLGGTFYVTDITWNDTTNEAIVEYEDGHISLKAQAIIGIYENNEIAVDDFVLLEEQ